MEEYSSSWNRISGGLNRQAQTFPRTEREDLQIVGSISTLHPRRLKASDLVDLSGQTSVIIRVNLQPKLRMVNRRLRQQPSIPESDWKMYQTIHFPVHHPFPPNTRGFFYWDSKVAGPNLARQIRFRIVESGDPKHLASGRQLVIPGCILPWNIPLSGLADTEFTKHHALRSLVWQDGLCNPDELFFVLAMARHHPSSHLINPVCALGQPFEVMAGKTGFDINIVTSRGAFGLKLWNLFCRTDGSGQKIPYNGMALFAFRSIHSLKLS